MANIYSKNLSQECDKNQNPKQETIDFILNYSKALRVINAKSGKFEALLN